MKLTWKSVTSSKNRIVLLSGLGCTLFALALFVKANINVPENDNAIPTQPVTRRYSTLNETPDCASSKDDIVQETISLKKYEDKYNYFSISIPQNYTLLKGPGESFSDAEWQKITYKKNTFSFGFITSPSTKNVSPVDSIGISLNSDECNKAEFCYDKKIKEISTYQSYISSCKLSMEIDGKQIYFVGTQFSNPSFTSWYAYMDTKYGVIKFSYLESGDKFMTFNNEFIKVFDSFSFTK